MRQVDKGTEYGPLSASLSVKVVEYPGCLFTKQRKGHVASLRCIYLIYYRVESGVLIFKYLTQEK